MASSTRVPATDITGIYGALLKTMRRSVPGLLSAKLRAGFDTTRLRQGSLFTRGGKQRMPGTSSYATPLDLLRLQGADARSDLFSLGIVLYELLSGKRPPTRGSGRRARRGCLGCFHFLRRHTCWCVSSAPTTRSSRPTCLRFATASGRLSYGVEPNG